MGSKQKYEEIDYEEENKEDCSLEDWSIDLWKAFPLKQQPIYPDPIKVETVTNQLKQLPSLVTFQEIHTLNTTLHTIREKSGFVLQLGDCVEMFHRTDSLTTAETLRFFARMAQFLQSYLEGPICTMGRIAGQFAKPRTLLTESVNGFSVPSFHGEIINGFSLDQRIPNPNRMLKAYDVSRFLIQDIRQYSPKPLILGETFFTQHEAYLLPYEEGLCRQNPDNGLWYATSAHAIWIGNWTIGEDNAHIHFVRGLANPIGMKIGPQMSAAQLRNILEIIAPHKRNGAVILIPRLGLSRLEESLPRLIEVAKDYPVLWVLDPMHGNTVRVQDTRKTRRVGDIMGEIRLFHQVMSHYGVRYQGLHCEVTPDDVTECLDEERGLSADKLSERYWTGCDPRLNPTQFLGIMELIAHLWKK